MAAQPRNGRAACSFTVERARRARGRAGSARREPLLASLVDLQAGAVVWHEATGRPLLGQFATCGARHVVQSCLVGAPRVSSPGAMPPAPDELCHQGSPRGAAATTAPPGARSDARARPPCRSGARAHGAWSCRRAAQEQRQDGEHEGERSRREHPRAAGSRSSAWPAVRRALELALVLAVALVSSSLLGASGRRFSGSRRRNPCRRCGRRACRPSRRGTRGRSSAAASRPPCRWRARGHRGNPARP